MSRPELGPRNVEVHSEELKFEPENAVRALVLAMAEPVSRSGAISTHANVSNELRPLLSDTRFECVGTSG